MHVTLPGILWNAPVFLLIAYLTFQGIRRLKGGVLALPQIWIAPGIFILWGLSGLFQGPSGDALHTLLRWCLGALPGFALGFLTPMSLQADRAKGLLLVPGNVLPLLRILIVFGGHYALLGLYAAQPNPAHNYLAARYLDWDRSLFGACAGYFLGWAVRFCISYAKAQPLDLKAALPQAA